MVLARSIRHALALFAISGALLVLGACRDDGPPLEDEDAGVIDARPNADAAPADDASTPDASDPTLDAGFKLRAFNLAPASGTTTSTAHQLRGSLGASSTDLAESPRFKLRAKLTPLAR
jgi:hypothetical protein